PVPLPPVRLGDRPLPIRSVKPRHHVGDNRLRVFGTGIIGGENHHVTVLSGDASHLGPLPPVAISAASHHTIYGSPGKLAYRYQHILQTVRRVGVVDQYGEG